MIRESDCTAPCQHCGDQVPVREARFRETWRALPSCCVPCAARLEREEAEQEEALERERQRRAFDRRVLLANVPEGYVHHRLRDLDATGSAASAIPAAQGWATADTGGLLLTGDVGVGKTTIAAAAAMQHLWKRNLHWYSAHGLLRALQSQFDSPERRQIHDLLDGRDIRNGRRPAALVLDDIDKARPSEWAAEQIFSVLDSATSQGRKLLVTSNVLPSQIAARWPAPHGQAIASRLVGHCRHLKLEGNDRRVA